MSPRRGKRDGIHGCMNCGRTWSSIPGSPDPAGKQVNGWHGAYKIEWSEGPSRALVVACEGCTPRGGHGQRVAAGEETSELRVRVGDSHLEMLDQLVSQGYARDRSAATRKAIEEAHRGR